MKHTHIGSYVRAAQLQEEDDEIRRERFYADNRIKAELEARRLAKRTPLQRFGDWLGSV